ncbi:MAG: GSCFA domain-containing protein [Prevotella sp.]|nr:GSCFA domain-containing protein [Prevotella sp.]
MHWNTPVNIEKPGFFIQPCEEILFVGSCFADNMARCMGEDKFRVTVNPFGTMYNPASVLHTIERLQTVSRVAFITLGTNRVYVLKETGEIVDNCQKRPARLFDERELTVDGCVDYLRRCVEALRLRRPEVHVVFTVSPIRYAKYGFHGSQLSKATLLLAIQKVLSIHNSQLGNSQLKSPSFGECTGTVSYFPAYEIVLDELRDYRFYAPDMIHPSEQAVDYIYQRLADTFFSDDTKQFLSEWQPLKEALNHHPFHPESAEYQSFMKKRQERLESLKEKYPGLET